MRATPYGQEGCWFLTNLKRKDFRLLMLLGLGQTAQVYLAEAPSGEKVALKLPRKEVRQDPKLAERFAREVSLSLSLKHPHLVRGLHGVPFGEEAFFGLGVPGKRNPGGPPP